MIDINGKWALVTGSSRGIGSVVAKALAERGCNIVLHSRQKEHNQKIEASLRQLNVQCFSLEADLADPTAARRLAEEAEAKSGGIEILYNNAAVMSPWRSNSEAVIADYQTCFNVNVISLICICDVILPKMLERGFGRIVNVTSGIEHQPELMAYAVSKAAVDKYVRDSAIRLNGSNVLMNLLDPGWLRTDLGGSQAPNDLLDVLPGALVPGLLDAQAGSGKLYRALDYQLAKKQG
jgi:NAD(P)-dependent dehydrogenase (short-subunit alcohol dehydrogenase family)